MNINVEDMLGLFVDIIKQDIRTYAFILIKLREVEIQSFTSIKAVSA